jgi:hypothetical protein
MVEYRRAQHGMKNKQKKRYTMRREEVERGRK